MPADFTHPFVGRAVVYRAGHPGAEPEQGVVSSVNEAAWIVFVRYGSASSGTATSADDRLTFLDGSPVVLNSEHRS